ncbi:MAG: hypothetical protein E7310_06310 [Clostridiales bacterium]|nr:hypothetical protein [Clostridiales bacterium]
MEQEILNALKRIETKLDYPSGVPTEKLVLYDIKDLMEITDLGYNKVWNFFKDKEKYPTFPRISCRKKVSSRG